MLGEVSCEVLSGATEIAISEQPTLVQTTAPLGGQTVCIGTAIDPITFQFGGSATGIRLVNIPGGLTTATDAAAKTVTISGIPTGTGFVRVTTEGTTCQIQTLQHFVRVTTAPQIPDYILIDDAAGGTDPIPIINRTEDGNIYNGQIYLCEQALATSPGSAFFTACYNDGRIAPLTESYNWFISPPDAGTISRTTGFATWNDGFIGDVTVQVVAVGCDGSATATLTTVVTVNQFNSSASNPTQPIPLLEQESEIIYIRENAGNIRSEERFNITINGVRYTYETTDRAPANGLANEDSEQIAIALAALINNDTTSPIAGLFTATPGRFDPGDANANGLNDDRGGFVRITAQYEGNSAPPNPPGNPRGAGGDMRISFSVTKSPAAREPLEL